MDVRLQGHFTTKSPLSHQSESIGTTAYLVQEPVLQADGTVEEVFCYAGNAWRGQLRDLAATYLLHHVGDPTISLDAFHLLYSGGRIGGEQSVNVEQARAYRRLLPILSLLGGGVGNQVLPGKLRVSNAYPVCREALPVLLHTDPADAAPVSYRALTIEKSFSRTDDAKNPKLAGAIGGGTPTQAALLGDGGAPAKPGKRDDGPADQMRMTVELLIAGVRLETRIDGLDVSEVELGCLVSALHTFARSPFIGGQSGKGHGLVDLDYRLLDLDAGEARPFLAVAGGRIALSEPAERAKDAYDAHLRAVYDALLDAKQGEIRRMLGAVA